MFPLKAFCFIWLLMITTPSEALADKGPAPCFYNDDPFRLYFFAICTKSNLTTVPTYLQKDIEGLHLSWNPIRLLRNNSFAIYPKLLSIYLDRIPTLELESHAFANLTALKILDLSFSPRVNVSNLYFPPSLLKLFLEGITTIGSELRISSLRYLSFLSLSECNLSEIPSFGGNLPSLREIDLSANKLENFKFDSLGYVCRLLTFHFTEHVSIQNNCECLKLKNYIELRTEEMVSFSCNGPSNADKNCTVSPTMSPIFVKNFEACAKDIINTERGVLPLPSESHT